MTARTDLAGDASGFVAIEFALLLPVLITIFCGLIEVTQGVIVYMKLASAAETVSDLVAQQQSVSDSSVDDYYTAAQLVMAPAATDGLGLAVASVTFDAANGTPSIAWQETRGPGVAMNDLTTAVTGLGASSASGAADSVIVAEATYTYTSLLQYLLQSPITLTQRDYSRPRLVATVPLQ